MLLALSFLFQLCNCIDVLLSVIVLFVEQNKLMMMMMIKLTCKKKRSDDISRWLVSAGDRSWRPHCRLSVTPSVCLLQSVAMSVDISVYIGDTVANVVAAAAAAAVNLEKFSINDVDWDWLVRSSPTHKQPVTQQPPYLSRSLSECACVCPFPPLCPAVNSKPPPARSTADMCALTTAPLPELSSWLVALRFSNRGTRW